MSAAAELLVGLQSVPGVQGCCLLDTARGVIAHTLKPPYEPLLVQKVLEQFDVVMEMQRTVDGLEVPRLFQGRFASGVLVLRWFDLCTLFVLGAPNLNLAMVTVASNALQVKIATSGLVAGMQTRPPLTLSSGWRTGPAAPVEPAPPPPLPQTTGPQRTGPVPAGDLVPVERLRELAAALARALGPLSTAVVKREVERLGYHTRELPRAALPEVVERCTAQITDGRARAEFAAAARTLLQR